jgi:non-specific serine/threonine protein kinase
MWRFEFEGRTVHARDSKGLRHVAALLSQPGVEIHALQLVQGAELGAMGETATPAGELPSLDLGAGVGPALDDDAKAAYRLRIEDLREELDQAERWADLERASRARDEIDFIGRELAAAVGIGGRDRPQHADAERARVNVTRAIRTAVRRLAERDVGLGAELDATIRTGLFCRHEPDLRRPVSWEVDGG